MGSQSLPTVRLATPSGDIVCERCEVALTTLSRLRGSFDHRSRDENGNALLKKPASWTHTLFRSESVDIVFLDADLRVVKMVAHMVPWRLAACSRASAVVTLPAGHAGRRGIHLGLRLISNPTATV